MALLSGKTAIVTGASVGIGNETARLFAREGAKVVVGARRQVEFDTLVSEIAEAGGSAAALAGDVKDEAFAKASVELAICKFGGPDIALNNASTLGPFGAPVPDISLAEWDNTLATNLTSAFLGAKYQIPAIKESAYFSWSVLSQRGGPASAVANCLYGLCISFGNMQSRALARDLRIGRCKSFPEGDERGIKLSRPVRRPHLLMRK